VTSDNTQAGRLAGHELAERVRPGSKVAIVDGLRKNANADRVAGFRDALRDHPEVTVVAHEYGLHDDVASGRAAARRVLSAHPEVAGIFAVCDPIALGVAAHLTGRDRWLAITAVGGRALATAAQDPVRLIRAAMDLGRELHDDKRPPQRVLLMPVRLISAANAAGYQPWG
jgi:ribose transport system substrate-binding protein